LTAAQSNVSLDYASVPGSARRSSTGRWVQIAVLAIAFIALYHNNLERLWSKTNLISGDRNWAHAMCIPVIGVYYLFLRRDELKAAPIVPLIGFTFTLRRLYVSLAMAAIGAAVYFITPHVIPQSELFLLVGPILSNAGQGLILYGILVLLLDWGLGTLLAGLMLTVYGIFPGQNDYIWDAGMIVTLIGMVLTLCGWSVMRLVWFPILFLLCAIPWPPTVYSQIASPLQVLAARTSVLILQIFGIDASYGGTKIFIPQFGVDGSPLPARALNVAEACAGLIALMSFISIAATVAFLSSRPLWQKIVITLSAIPIAIFCNVIRVAGVAMLDIYAGHEWSEGFAHQFAGMVLYLPAFFLIMLVCWIVDQIFIEESDVPVTAAAGRAVGGAA
jgi:exosortase